MQKKLFQKCKRIIKKVIPILFFILTAQSLFAGTGPLLANKNLRVSKTQWFDIIYPEENKIFAEIMFKNADGIYKEISEAYGVSPSFRMPIVVVPTVDKLNAFWTAAPYNHIVIYDTSINNVGELSTYSETLLSVFRHEITHAVTNNMKNSFWKGVGKIFGDPVAPGMLTISSGIAEGATVTYESADGEGRLNDEYSKQAVKQAKIENKFPSYYDVKGSGDVYPMGAPYYFNGAFHQWLQDKYGMEAYAKFWFNLVNGEKLFINSNFKNAFGLSIKKAWKTFFDEYPVPEVPANPINSSTKDFFNSDASTFSKYNKSRSLYSSITKSTDALYWIDETSNKIQYVPFDSVNNKKIAPKTLFSMDGIEEINISNDGKYMAISYFSEENIATMACTKIYDFTQKKFYKVKNEKLKNSAIIQQGNQYFLVANKYASPNNSVVIYNICFNEKGSISDLKLIKEIIQPLNDFSFEFTQIDDGVFAYIKKSKLNYSICIEAVNKDFNVEYTSPIERMVLGSLSFSENKLYFSWTKPNSMPRSGSLNIENGTMELCNEDFSGGIYEPVAINNQSEIIYIGHFYKENRILRTTRLPDTQVILKKISPTPLEIAEEPIPEISEDLNFTEYNPFSYLTRGILAPVSIYETEYFGCNSTYDSNISLYPIGLTYITANPWTNGNNDLYTLTGGWNYLNNSFGLDLTAVFGSDTNLLTNQFNLKNEFDGKGWKLSTIKYSLSSTLPFGNISSLFLENDVAFKIGRQDKRALNLTVLDAFNFISPSYFNCVSSENDTIYSSISNLFTVGYTNVHKAGASRFKKAGINTSLSFEFRKDTSITAFPTKYVDYFNIYPNIKGYLPWLLPTKLNLSILPANSIKGYALNKDSLGYSIMDFKTESILFSYETQKAIPFFSALFINDFYISAGYAFTLGAAEMTKYGFELQYLPEYLEGAANGKAKFADAAFIKACVELTPNLGVFAKSGFKMNLYSMITYSFKSPEYSIPITVNIGTQANF